MATLEDLLSERAKQNLMQIIDKGDVIRMKLTEAEGITPKNSGDTEKYSEKTNT